MVDQNVRRRTPKNRQFTWMGILAVCSFIGLFTVCVYATASKMSHDERTRNLEEEKKVTAFEDSSFSSEDQDQEIEILDKIQERNRRSATDFCSSNPKDCVLKMEATIRFKDKKGKSQEKVISMTFNQPIKDKDFKSVESEIGAHYQKSLKSWKSLVKKIKPNTKVTLEISIDIPFADNQLINFSVIEKNKKKYTETIAGSIAKEAYFVVVSNQELLEAKSSGHGDYNYDYDYDNQKTTAEIQKEKEANSREKENVENLVGNVADWGTDSINTVWNIFGGGDDLIEKEVEKDSNYDYNNEILHDSSQMSVGDAAKNAKDAAEVEAVVGKLAEWGVDSASRAFKYGSSFFEE